MKKSHKKLPSIPTSILKKILPFEEQSYLLGDFEEEYLYLLENKGAFKAKFWYWTQCLTNLPEFAKDSLTGSMTMLKNYLKIAFRNIKRSKSYTFINVSGLAAGIICCLLIMLYVQFELSYDKYHQNADRTYRIGMERTYPDKVRNWGWTAPLMASTVQNDYPEVEIGTRLYSNGRAQQVSYEDKSIVENGILYADGNFFDVFSIRLLTGDAETALNSPNKVILTEETAKKYFGNNDPVGKTITIGSNNNDGNLSYLVTGVTENVPENTHFDYDFLVSFSSHGMSAITNWTSVWRVFSYIVLNEGTDPVAFEAKLSGIIDNHLGPQMVEVLNLTSFEDYLAAGNGYRLFLTPVTDIHLKSHLEQELQTNANITYVYMFGFIAVFILLIACINFMNLSTARYANRAKEVGLRKALGSFRTQLIGQFLCESILMSLISLFAGLFLVELLLPSFSAIVGNTLTTSYFSSYLILPGILGFALLVGIISGSYPAFFLSAFRPTQALKGAVSRGAKSGLLRNSLVIFQFATSIALIVGTFIIKEQVDFLLNKDLGYDKDHIVVLQGAAALDQQVDIFKNELNKHANIVSSAGSFTYPGQARDGVTFRPRGATLDQAISISDIFVDFDYVQTMGLQLIDGRDFSREMASDSMGLILNETAYKSLNLDNPVGKQLTDGSDDSYFNIIGIMKDFHFKSLHNDITPAQLNLIGNGRANFLAVRIRPAGTTETIAYIERTWNEFTGGSPFLYEFLDENIREAYRAEQKTGQISSLFSVLAIGIGCLGLLGLAAFTAEQRTKEIGVRKVLGATVTNVVFLLSEEFIKLVGLAFVFAVPLSYYLMSRWLDNFAYSTNVSIMTFVFAGILTLIIALLTVSYQVIKAANQDPVRSLRAE